MNKYIFQGFSDEIEKVSKFKLWEAAKKAIKKGLSNPEVKRKMAGRKPDPTSVKRYIKSLISRSKEYRGLQKAVKQKKPSIFGDTMDKIYSKTEVKKIFRPRFKEELPGYKEAISRDYKKIPRGAKIGATVVGGGYVTGRGIGAGISKGQKKKEKD